MPHSLKLGSLHAELLKTHLAMYESSALHKSALRLAEEGAFGRSLGRFGSMASGAAFETASRISQDILKGNRFSNVVGALERVSLAGGLSAIGKLDGHLLETNRSIAESLRMACGLAGQISANSALGRYNSYQKDLLGAIQPARMGMLGAVAHSAQLSGVLGSQHASAFAALRAASFALEAEKLSRNVISEATLTAFSGVQKMARASERMWVAAEERSRIRPPSNELWLRNSALELFSATRSAIGLTSASDFLPAPETAEVNSGSTTEFEELLRDFDRDLVVMYRGAVDTVRRKGSDWERHSLISLRELLHSVLATLAPEKDVRAWATDGHYENGKLKHRARFEFILRHENHGGLSGFLRKDFDAAIALISVLNRVHEKRPSLTENQLEILLSRVQGLIGTLLQAVRM